MLPIVVRLLSLAPLRRSSRSLLRLLAWLGLVAAGIAREGDRQSVGRQVVDTIRALREMFLEEQGAIR